MLRSTHAFALAALAIVPAGYALAQTPLGSLSGTVIEGEVGEVFGQRFILEDGSGRTLVDPAAAFSDDAQLSGGDRVVVVGDDTPDGFVARSITLADGTVILSAPAQAAAAPAPAPRTETAQAPQPASAAMSAADAQAMLENSGLFSRVWLDEDDDGHFEFEAVDTDGREVDIDVRRDGTIYEIDVDDDRRANTNNLADLLPEALRSAVAERGIVDLIEFETKGRHYEVEGYDANGRKVEFEIGADARTGSISVESERRPAPANVDVDAARARVEAVGYVVQAVETKPRHIEMVAMSPEGAEVKLDVDFEGEVYRERLIR
ncbi:PepSY domain-containing protein [Pelagibacterium montanilacus]|uniref:PepSY domain-containing protein n=1 Tax=Pelagibacterium montanilacus TaxID=2185280 RepID=UPI0013E073CD|nr:PepSY domain-containing protein [Pelagibacterium montanilacus]